MAKPSQQGESELDERREVVTIERDEFVIGVDGAGGDQGVGSGSASATGSVVHPSGKLGGGFRYRFDSTGKDGTNKFLVFVADWAAYELIPDHRADCGLLALLNAFDRRMVLAHPQRQRNQRVGIAESGSRTVLIGFAARCTCFRSEVLQLIGVHRHRASPETRKGLHWRESHLRLLHRSAHGVPDDPAKFHDLVGRQAEPGAGVFRMARHRRVHVRTPGR